MRYFFIFLLVIFTALIGYCVLRGYQTLREFPIARNVYLISTIVLFLFMIGGTFLSSFTAIPFARTIAFIGNTALIIFLYLIISFLLVDIVRLLNYFFHFAPEGMIIFRKWALICSLGIIAVTLIIGNYKFNHPKIINLELKVENNRPLQNRELKIVTASDIHLGTSINKKRLKKYVNLINEQKPDIVLLAGDICDNRLQPIIDQNMHEELQMIQAPLGVHAVLGNHEYISRDVTHAIEYLQKGNINILRDSNLLVDNSFYIIGRDDRTNPNRKSIQELVSQTDKSKVHVMLDHQPYHLEEAEANEIDLQISGHTHDGQFFPVNLIVRSMYENAHGYSKRNGTHYYVSSGLGLWGPQYRIGTQSELIVIKLKY